MDLHLWEYPLLPAAATLMWTVLAKFETQMAAKAGTTFGVGWAAQPWMIKIENFNTTKLK